MSKQTISSFVSTIMHVALKKKKNGK